MSDCCNEIRPLTDQELDILHVSRGVSRRTVLKAMGASAGALMLGGMMRPGHAADLKKIRLAFCSQLLCVVPYEATRAAGFFAEEGLDVELVYTRGGSAALQALNGGAVDYAATSFDAALSAYANGANIARFATTGQLPLFALVSSPEMAGSITDVEALRGRTIGVAALGTSDHALALFLLDQAGVPGNEVEFATLGTNLYHALRLGQVDAGMVQEPALSLLQEKGARVLMNGMDIDDATRYLGGPYEFMGVSVRRDEREARKAEMQALARALVKGLQYVQEASPADLVDALPKEIITGGDRERVALTLERYRASLYPREVTINRQACERVMDAHLKAGIQDEPIDLDRILDPSIIGS